METELAIKMITRADIDNLSGDHELRIKALLFDDASKKFYSSPQECSIKHFMKCWAQARRIWCNYSGEPLI